MEDPSFEALAESGSLLTSNNDWHGSLASAFTAAGAFPFAVGSKDAAASFGTAGSFTVKAKGTGAGLALVEVYDSDYMGDSHLINVSARSKVGTGADVLIVGFTVRGVGTTQVLVRAVGPSLSKFGVPGTLVDPILSLFDSKGARIDQNDNWAPTLQTAFSQVGAFALEANSFDAALVATIHGGQSYTVQVEGVGGKTGEALVEVYEIQ
ncbi:MAG: hypothetical protein U1F61_22860 [Opitutaceae bacterium]